MKNCDTILATGGPGMVKSRIFLSKTCYRVGAGNTPVIIDDSRC